MKNRIRHISSLALAICLCLSLCAISASAVDESQMPVAGNDTYGEYGEIGKIKITLNLEKSGSSYTATYTASTTMVEWLAQAAAVCKDDSRMQNLRFTCTLKDALTAKLTDGSVTKDSYSFTSALFPKSTGKPIFILVDEDEAAQAVTVSDKSLKLRYKLNPEVISAWSLATAQKVKDALQQPMSMTATKGGLSLSSVGSSKITTTAEIDITMSDGGKIPFYGESLIVAARGTCKTTNPEYSGGGGGGTTQPGETTVIIVDTTPSKIDPKTGELIPSEIPVGGGKTKAQRPDAKPGETVKLIIDSDPGSMIDYISVKDNEGKLVPLSYEGKGVYTFEMPKEGKVTASASYRVVPADPKETGVARLLNTDDHTLYMIGDDLGLFRPNASITRAEVATAFFRLLRDQNVPITKHFNDVASTAWYVQPVETLASLNILEGVGNDNFEPKRPITRAEFAAVAARFANELTAGASFKDVDENAWYAIFVSTAAHFGWINGVGDGMYEPNRPITRTEAAAIINRMLFRISDWIDVDAGHGRQFPDVDKNFWGRYEISEATNDHDYDSEEKFYYEDWTGEDWQETVDNDPVNFGQPKE